MKITKICSFILALITLAALFCSCGNSDVPDGMKSVTPSAMAFNLYVPKGWYDNSACGTASATYSSTDRSNVSMTAMLLDSNYSTLDEYMVYVDASLKAAIPGYELLPSGTYVDSAAIDSAAIESSGIEDVLNRDFSVMDAVTVTKLGGISAYSFNYKAKMDGKDYKFLQIVCIKSNDFYIFTYSAEASVYDSHITEVNTIIDNVRFK